MYDYQFRTEFNDFAKQTPDLHIPECPRPEVCTLNVFIIGDGCVYLAFSIRGTSRILAWHRTSLLKTKCYIYTLSVHHVNCGVLAHVMPVIVITLTGSPFLSHFTRE